MKIILQFCKIRRKETRSSLGKKRMSLLKSAVTIVVFGSLQIQYGRIAAAAATTNSPTGKPPVTAKDFFNAGAKNLSATNLSDAEAMFQAALAKQDETVQPLALYNLGHVRFAQGSEELKKNPMGSTTTLRAELALNAAGSAIQSAEAALAANDVQQMVEAYLRGRGARKQLRTAYDAVQRALKTYGSTLQKWRRSLGDFQGAAELNPSDTNATYNISVVEQNIAALVDSLMQLQIPANGAGDMDEKLKELLSQLKGKIPQGMLPGGPGDEGEEDVNGRPVEDFIGMKGGGSTSGEEMEISLSPEEAGNLLDGFKLGGERPLSSITSVPGEKGDPKDRKLRDW
jgi:hypothetical protein